jgi:cbb3-type cytochrome oxidase subunit 3
MPLPVTPGMDATQAHSLQTAARVGVAVIAVLFAAMMAIGVWWLVYFNLKSVRAAFAGTTGDLAENRRPLLLSVYAVLLIAGVIALSFPVYMHLPAVLFALILRGWASTAFYVCCAVLNVAVGIGLWRLREWARRLALVVIAFGFVQCCFYLFRPTLIEQFTEETDRAMKLPAASPSYLQGPMHIFMFCISLLFTAAIACMLYYYRDRFKPPAQQEAELPAPIA